MKKTHLLVLFAILMLLFTACSEKDDKNPTDPTTPIVGNPPAMALTADYVFDLPAEGTEYPDSVIVDIEYSGAPTPGIPLTYFITKAMTDELVGNNKADDTRSLFAYEPVGSDGISSRKNGDDDIFWSLFKEGYLLPENAHRVFFENPPVNAYNVKYLDKIKLYRAVQVIKPNGDKVLFELNALETQQVANHNDAQEAGIELKSFISTFVTETPANYTYEFMASDEFAVSYTWEQIQDGYWLKDSKTTIFPTFNDDMSNSQKKFKKLMQIKLIPAE